ncbi:MAG TPA: hypothetical protein VK008_01980, partial [Sphingobacteriaceae bacterium]|nr:hypothetical protein [Sphingobacteriaceae bacterium]
IHSNPKSPIQRGTIFFPFIISVYQRGDNARGWGSAGAAAAGVFPAGQPSGIAVKLPDEAYFPGRKGNFAG